MQAQIIQGHLVLHNPNLGQLKQVFPDMRVSQIEGHTYVAVRHTIDASIVLTNIGYEVPSPILTGYTWPGQFKPYSHQMHTASFATLNRRAFILNGMGTGKTLSVLWAADYLMSLGLIKSVLIMSPLSTLERVWGDEIFKNFPHRTFAVLHGSRQKRIDLLAQHADFYIINHDGIKIVGELLTEKKTIDAVIIDELAAFRNHKTDRWKAAKAICKPERIVWGLTGTPTPNEPTDAFGQSKLVKPENFNGHFTRFKMITMQQITNFRWIPRTGSEQIVSNALKPAIRYALQDCIELPETIYHHRSAELSHQQQHHFNELKRTATTTLAETDVTAVNAAVLVSKMLQVTCGVMYGPNGEPLEIDFGPRLEVLKECIEESEGKVIIFVPFTGVLDALHGKLNKHWTCGVIDGGVSSGKRNKIFSEFQDTPNPRILLANPQTMAHGLSLTAATTIIWYAPVYSNEIYEQANARIVRPGQKLKTNIVHIAATTLERNVYAVLRERGRLQSVVLKLAKEGK